MSDKTTATPATTRPAPFKRVKYSLGLVLGVDEFEQEQAFFKERDRLQNRALHGYGTVWGLDVAVEAGSRIRIKPGLAVDRLGREICVPDDQCADLAAWLSRPENKSVLPTGGSGAANVYVTLCYRECLSDKVPIPGAPCRTEDETMAPSRITESFALKLSRQKPAMNEITEVRRLVRLLNRLEVWHAGEEVVDPGPFEEITPAAIRTKLAEWLEEAKVARRLRISPPHTLEDVLQAAYEAWVLRLRAKLHPACAASEQLDAVAAGACCDESADSPQAECVLLAELKVTFKSGAIEKVEADIAGRPYLLHTQLLQELLQRQSVHSHLTGLRNDDHPQYLLVKADAPNRRCLLDDLHCDNHRLTDVHDAINPRDAIPWAQQYEGWTGPATTKSDLGGSYRYPLVTALRGAPLSATDAPKAGDVLAFNGSEWFPEAKRPHMPDLELTSIAPAGLLIRQLPGEARERLQKMKAQLEGRNPIVLAIWIHPVPPGAKEEPIDLESIAEGLTVWDVAKDADWIQIKQVVVLGEPTPNQFVVALLLPDHMPRTLGFRFDLEGLLFKDGTPLIKVLKGRSGPTWLGQRESIVVDYYQYQPEATVAEPPAPQEQSPVAVVAAARFNAKGDVVGQQVGKIQRTHVLPEGCFVLAVDPPLESGATYLIQGTPIMGRDQKLGVFEQVTHPDFPKPEQVVIRSAALLNQGGAFDPKDPLKAAAHAGFYIEISRVAK